MRPEQLTKFIGLLLFSIMLLLGTAFVPTTGLSYYNEDTGKMTFITKSPEDIAQEKYDEKGYYKQIAEELSPYIMFKSDNPLEDNEVLGTDELNLSQRTKREARLPQNALVSNTATNNNKQCEKMTKAEFYEITGLKNKTIAELIKKLEIEFDRYPMEASYKYGWLRRLLTSNDYLISEGTHTVCSGLYFDIEDNYDGISLDSVHNSDKPRQREMVYFQSDENRRLKTKTVDEKLRYFLRKLLWCDVKLPENSHLREENALGMKRLLSIYRKPWLRKALAEAQDRINTVVTRNERSVNSDQDGETIVSQEMD